MLPTSGTLLSFDFGTKRIGVAVGEIALWQAHPLETIHEIANAPRFLRIAALIGKWQPVGLVVGYPMSIDGTLHDMSARAARFARQLEGRFALPVVLVDERYSSLAAEARLHEAGLSALASKAHVDAVAAQLILDMYFAQLQKEQKEGMC